MRKMSYVAFIFAFVLLLSGCGRGLYFGTATSVGLDVSGTGKVPNKVSFAYDRGEVVIVPEDVSGTPHSVFASLDSEWTWLDGFYVSQIFATGKAAEIVTEPKLPACTQCPPEKPTGSGMPLLFVTGTKLGIAIEVGQTDSAPMSLLVGYRRAEITLMPDVAGQPDIEPVFADMTIDSRDITTTARPELPTFGGVRIKQRIATGKAAVNAATYSEMRNKLRGAVYGLTSETMEKNQKKEAILQKFGRLDSTKKDAYLKTLNAAFGKTGSGLLTPDNFKTEIYNLNDLQFKLAEQEIESL